MHFLLYTLLFFIFIFFIINLFIRFIIRSFSRQNGQKHTEKKRKDGEITVIKKDSNKKVIDKNEGDYIDFEEMDR